MPDQKEHMMPEHHKEMPAKGMPMTKKQKRQAKAKKK